MRANLAAPGTERAGQGQIAERYYWLDGLRLLAATLVVMEHARGVVFLPYAELQAGSKTALTAVFFAGARLGTEAVLVFFVLSGFLVGGLGFARLLQGRFRVQDYFVDRMVRLWLPLVPALLLTVIVAGFTEQRPGGPLDVLANLFFLQGVAVSALSGNEPLWTLSYEFWFYLLLGAIALAARGSLAGFLLLFLGLGIFTVLVPKLLFCWVLGAAVFFVRPESIRWPLLIAAIFAATAAVVSMQLNSKSGVIVGTGWRGWLIPSNQCSIVLAVSIALIVRVLSVKRPSAVASAWVEGLLGRGAAFSYTLYLTHYPILAAVAYALGRQRSDDIGFDSIVAYLALVLLCFAAAYLLYRMFEAHTATVRQFVKRQLACWQRPGCP